MSNGPLPSTLTFLSSLPSISAGSKVRFLGCVASYRVSSATLSLQHAYPDSQTDPVVALVNVNLLLESLKREDTQVGAWVNVMGYVDEVCDCKRGLKEGTKDEREDSGIVQIKVKAIMLWSAGGVKLGEYERALEGRLRIQKKNP